MRIGVWSPAGRSGGTRAGGRARMSKWQKRTLKLRDDHTWSGRPGCRVFVADRGAVRFDFPQDWIVIPQADSIRFHDKQPPDDDCVLGVSYLRLPPIDWSG